MATETKTTDTTAVQREQARKDRRAAAARRRYHENIEESRERCRVAKIDQRLRDGSEFPPKAGRASYDPQDYAEEWMWLTHLGMRSDVIIERSRPSREWFIRRVLPLVSRSICALCNEVYDTRAAGMLTRCSNACTGRDL